MPGPPQKASECAVLHQASTPARGHPTQTEPYPMNAPVKPRSGGMVPGTGRTKNHQHPPAPASDTEWLLHQHTGRTRKPPTRFESMTPDCHRHVGGVAAHTQQLRAVSSAASNTLEALLQYAAGTRTLRPSMSCAAAYDMQPWLQGAGSTAAATAQTVAAQQQRPDQWPGSMLEIKPFRRRVSTYVSAWSCAHATTRATPVSWASCGLRQQQRRPTADMM